MTTDKPLPIAKVMVWKAYQQVKRNGHAAGVDGQSLDDFRAPRRIGIWPPTSEHEKAAKGRQENRNK